LFDDAMVSMRFARNLADGRGLVWNEGQRVEGYSNFAWTLLMAAIHAVGVPDRFAPLVVAGVGAAVLVALVFVAERITRELTPTSWVRAVAAAAVATCYPLVFWTLRGMEVGLVALCVAGAVLAALRLGGEGAGRAAWWLGATLALAVLTRDDALAPAVVLLAVLAAWPRGFARSLLWRPASLVAAVVAGHTTFRVVYYGDWLPNTYFLKMQGVPIDERVARGAWALGSFVWWQAAIPLVLVATVVVLGHADRRVAVVLAPFGAGAAASVWVGGDAWEFFGFANRYLAAVLPLALIVASVAFERLRPIEVAAGLLVALAATLPVLGVDAVALQMWPAREAELRVAARRSALLALAAVGLGAVVPRVVPRWATAAVVLCLAVNLAPGRSWLRLNASNVTTVDRRAVQLGLAHARYTDPQATIAVVTAGTDAYLSGRPSVDLLGKSDARIARGPSLGVFHPGHSKHDYAYSVCSLRPDLVVELWKVSDDERATVEACGYERFGKGWVRSDTTLVDRDGLAAALATIDPPAS
jgi:hypothetical protein